MNEELQGAVEAHIRKRLAGHQPKKRHPEKDWADFTDAERKMAEIWHMLYFHDAPPDVQERWITEEVCERLPHAHQISEENGWSEVLESQDWFKIEMRWSDAKRVNAIEQMRDNAQRAPLDKKEGLQSMLTAFERNHSDTLALHQKSGVYDPGRMPFDYWQALFGTDGTFNWESQQIRQCFDEELKQIQQTYPFLRR